MELKFDCKISRKLDYNLLIVLNGIEILLSAFETLSAFLLIVLNGIEIFFIDLEFVLHSSFNRTKWN